MFNAEEKWRIVVPHSEARCTRLQPVSCRSAMATGRRRTSSSGDGAKVVFLRAYSGLWRLMPMRGTCRSTRPASAPTSTVPAPKKDGEDQAIGRSCGGLTTRIHAIVEALGNPVAQSLTPGRAADITQAAPLLDQTSCTALAPPATTSSPTLSLPPSRWFAYCSGSTDDRA